MAAWNVGLPMIANLGYGIANPTVQYTAISMASSATSQTSTIIASSSGYRVLLLGLTLTVSSNASITFQSHTTSSQATGVLLLTSGLVPLVMPFNPFGFFSSAISEGMDILSIGSAIGGMGTFIYI